MINLYYVLFKIAKFASLGMCIGALTIIADFMGAIGSGKIFIQRFHFMILQLLTFVTDYI